jgi:5-methylcytosine-specific restriction endonuclease McrBC GTP-binding regulatory subunit McrB
MLLAGISGTGKSRIVRKLAQATNTKNYTKEEDRWKDNRPDNFQLIQVKPNWHNSMDVVGFLSNIPEPHYVFTDFVRFIVKAWQHPETPYFLCLDEMNLAPVEEYFAEFLSAIESRAWDENGHYTTDPIISPFKDFGKEVCEAMLKELLGEARHTEANPLAIQFEEKGLTLPPNLMVMGTVNMDETTFSFSRKVLDRAMSVEMNEVKYDDFLDGKTELMPLLTEWNEKLVNRPQKAQEVQGEIDSQKVIDYLKAVNELLDSTPFKLGYRAANEAILYVAASQEFAQGTFSLEKALDEFTLMKILSRIEGDDSRLAIDENDERLQKAGLSESPLDNGEQNMTLLNGLRAIVRQHIGAETETEKKINHMYTTLCREHFVSYWA